MMWKRKGNFRWDSDTSHLLRRWHLNKEWNVKKSINERAERNTSWAKIRASEKALRQSLFGVLGRTKTSLCQGLRNSERIVKDYIGNYCCQILHASYPIFNKSVLFHISNLIFFQILIELQGFELPFLVAPGEWSSGCCGLQQLVSDSSPSICRVPWRYHFREGPTKP